MEWTRPLYSKPEINAAGRALAMSINEDWENWSLEQWDVYHEHLYIINNWRSSHAYPLNTFQNNLRHTTKRFDDHPLIAQRIKRITSIANKLDLLPKMKLSQMQDLGGCRAILANVGTVRRVVDYYLNDSAIKHERLAPDDYIQNPKESGYRGIHLIFRYYSDKNKNIYNGLKIEMQLRSKYQHAWATAVETVGMFSGEALKSSLGSEEWQRFFSLMGSVIALREKGALVPGTPTNRRELMAELADYAKRLNVEQRLREYGKALHTISNTATKADDTYYYLLELDPASGTLNVSGFGIQQQEEAENKYAEAEKLVQQKAGTDAVLVSVESVNSLSKAYPNYFADTRLFVVLMNQALTGRSRSIFVPNRQMDLQI